jgi:hypothetical protein
MANKRTSVRHHRFFFLSLQHFSSASAPWAFLNPACKGFQYPFQPDHIFLSVLIKNLNTSTIVSSRVLRNLESPPTYNHYLFWGLTKYGPQEDGTSSPKPTEWRLRGILNLPCRLTRLCKALSHRDPSGFQARLSPTESKTQIRQQPSFRLPN